MVSPVVLAAGEEQEVPWDRLLDVAGRYLAACSTPEKVKALNRKLKQRVEQRIADNSDLNEDNALRSLVLDWAAGNEDAVTRRDSEAVTQACVFLTVFQHKKHTLPESVRTRLTPEAVRGMTQCMKGEIGTVTLLSPQPDVLVVVESDLIILK